VPSSCEPSISGSQYSKGSISEVIEVLNDRFGTEFTEADQLFFGSVIEEAKADAEP
jgi:type I restriction enzyme, R subunit